MALGALWFFIALAVLLGVRMWRNGGAAHSAYCYATVTSSQR